MAYRLFIIKLKIINFLEKVFVEEREFFPMRQVILELPIRNYRAVLSRKSKIFNEKKYN